MLRNIEDILKHCEMYIKQTNTPITSKPVISCDDNEPYKQWAIDGIGTMPGNSQGKRLLLQESTSVLTDPLPRQYPITMKISLKDS